MIEQGGSSLMARRSATRASVVTSGPFVIQVGKRKFVRVVLS